MSSKLHITSVIHAYCKALHENDEAAMLSLFAPGARVHSFLVGEKPAPEFFKNLFANSRRVHFVVHKIWVDDSAVPHTGVLHLSFDAVWREKATLHVEAVDLFEFDDAGRITSLRIILDTAPFKALQAQLQEASNCG
jgi:hypothetical protein